MAKLRRNDPCPCGSGKKYKQCCLGKDAAIAAARVTGLEDVILEARRKGLEHDRATRDEAEGVLRALVGDPKATADDRVNITLGLVTLAQRRGDYRESLVQLEAISNEKEDLALQVLNLRAVALTQLGELDEAAEIYDKLLAEAEAKSNPILAWWYIEAGRTYSLAKRMDDAIHVTKKAVKMLEAKGDDPEHLARAKSNFAIFMLKSSDPKEVKHAEELLEEMCDLKIAIGDSEGAATNFSQLSLHHFFAGNFEKAIAYGRKDLKLSRLVGDERGLAATLGNLASMYLRLGQLSKARKVNGEAARIGDRLNNPDIQVKCAAVDVQIEEAGRMAGENGLPVGPKAPCACKSGKSYEHCCGRADHEPIALRMPIGGISEDIGDIVTALDELGVSPTKLDYAMRQTEEARGRISWSEIRGHDGWFEIFELPDMANIHLNAAEALAGQAKHGEDAIHEPLACAILAVSALEAFINSTIYFAHEAANTRPFVLPPELLTDPFAYQRHTELTLKWHALGSALCNLWPPPSPIWDNFVKLVQLRNELVHYKAEGFKRVAPADKLPPEQLRNLPPQIKLRDIPHSWPVRLLTPSFAEWAISVPQDLIRHFRSSYKYAIAAKEGSTSSNPS
jgi:tetratricopeptide (TPR) repeat protein